ncbi:ATP-binding protein, partial [Streptomyces nanshensis]
MTSSTTVRSPHRLYGRGSELAIIQGLLNRLRQGDGGALVLVAPPGLGRTALLREAAAVHRSRGPVLYATASAAGTGAAAAAAAATASADRAGPADCAGLGDDTGLVDCAGPVNRAIPADRAAS